MAPSLEDVFAENSVYGPLQWLWSISPARYAIESFYIQETAGYPWEELHNGEDRMLWNYLKSNFTPNLGRIAQIGAGWFLFSLLGLKLVHRARQK